VKTTDTCRECLLRRVDYITTHLDGERAALARQRADALLTELHRPGISPNVLVSSPLHEQTESLLGRDPWADLKQRSDAAARDIFPAVEAWVATQPDRFAAAATASIVGNGFDFGILGREATPESLAAEALAALERGLHDDDTATMRTLLDGGEVLYFTDNCGEIILDRLLLQALRAFPVRLTLVVKGGPVLTDATLADAERAGLADEVDEIITTGTNHVGLWLPATSAAFQRRVADATLIIAKGMGNYEAFTEWDCVTEWSCRPIAYLTMVKCQPVADHLGVPRGVAVCRLMT